MKNIVREHSPIYIDISVATVLKGSKCLLGWPAWLAIRGTEWRLQELDSGHVHRARCHTQCRNPRALGRDGLLREGTQADVLSSGGLSPNIDCALKLEWLSQLQLGPRTLAENLIWPDMWLVPSLRQECALLERAFITRTIRHEHLRAFSARRDKMSR